jgi:hypothetical protein
MAWTGCDENMKVHYASSEQAASDGAFERGWLPEVLRQGATDISESHDLDSNRGEASFDYSPSLLARLEKTCAKIPPTQPIKAPSTPWWSVRSNRPTSAKHSARGINAYHCGSFVIELDTHGHSGEMWHSR